MQQKTIKLVTFFLLTIVILGCQTNEKNGSRENPKIEKEKLLDISANRTMHYFCEVEDKFKICMDINEYQCKEIIKEVSPYCINRVMSEMPDIVVGREEYEKYAKKMTACIGMQMTIQTKKDFFEVDSCFRRH